RGWLTREQVRQAAQDSTSSPADVTEEADGQQHRRKLLVAGVLVGLLVTLTTAGAAFFVLGGPAKPDSASPDGQVALDAPGSAAPNGAANPANPEIELLPLPGCELLHEPREASAAAEKPAPEADPVKKPEPEPKPMPRAAGPRKKVRLP